MQAMIFAAGKGTRLKPLTDTMPKALVPIEGKPLIGHVIDKLYNSGFRTLTINVHHFADMIEEQVPSLINGREIRLHFSDEREELLDTGGGIKHAAEYLRQEERFLIHNCDILSNVNLKEFWSIGEEAEATLLVSERETQRYLIFEDTANSLRLVGWTNIKTGEVKSPFPEVHQAFSDTYLATEIPYSFVNFQNTPKQYRLLAFAGIHQMHSSLLDSMEHWQQKFSIIDFYLQLCATHKICGYIQPGLKLMDVGKMDTLADAKDFLKKIV